MCTVKLHLCTAEMAHIGHMLGIYIQSILHWSTFVSSAIQEQFQDRTAYTIMFGPDKCGEDYKLHFIFRHQNPLNKDLEEKHAKRPDVDLKKFYTDKKTHLYTLGTERVSKDCGPFHQAHLCNLM